MISNRKLSSLALIGIALGLSSVPVIADEGGASAEVYASLRAGLLTSDDDTDRTTEIVSRGSRIGLKGETKINDSLTAFAHYQWGADIVNEETDIFNRLGYAGLKGDWGSLRVGKDYHTFYNFNVAAGDIPWWLTDFAWPVYRGQTEQGLTYEGSFGGASLGLTAYFNNDDGEDNVGDVEYGFSYDFGFMTAAAAGISAGEDATGNEVADTLGFAVNGSAGPLDWYVGYQEVEDTADGIVIDLWANNFNLHVETTDNEDAAAGDPTFIALGYTLELSDNALVWFEYGTLDADGGEDYDSFEIVFKYDISSKDFK